MQEDPKGDPKGMQEDPKGNPKGMQEDPKGNPKGMQEDPKGNQKACKRTLRCAQAVPAPRSFLCPFCAMHAFSQLSARVHRDYLATMCVSYKTTCGIHDIRIPDDYPGCPIHTI